MPETNEGGPGPEEQKPESELPPDLEQEKREIEARIEQHIAKLEEIASVFGIDTSRFSDEDDQRSAEEMQSRSKIWKKQVVNEFNPPTTTFKTGDEEVERLDNYLNVGEIGIEITEQVAERGRIYSLWHPNGSILQAARVPGFCFSEEEAEAVRYFEHHRGKINYAELKSRLPAQLQFVELKRRARDDREIATFVEWLKSKNYTGEYSGDIFALSLPQQFQEQTGLNVEGKISDLYLTADRKRFKPGADYSGNCQRAHSLAGRIFNRIGEIFNNRVIYLIDRAKSGDPAFRELPEESTETEKVYEVDPNFQFTEEDARKARELNLPWSRIEKEMGEESAQE